MRISDWSSDVCSSDLLSIALGSTVGGILVDMSGYASTFAVSAAVLLGAAFLAFFAARADTTPAGSPNPPQRNTTMTPPAYGAHAADQPLTPLQITPRAVAPARSAESP